MLEGFPVDRSHWNLLHLLSCLPVSDLLLFFFFLVFQVVSPENKLFNPSDEHNEEDDKEVERWGLHCMPK